MQKTPLLIALALAALLVVTPVAVAKNPGAHKTPAPTPAPTPPSPVLARPPPGVFVIPTPYPMPAPTPAPTAEPPTSKTPARASAMPSPPTVERRVARFDAGAASASTLAPASAATSAPEPASAVIAATTLNVPAASTWPWAAPLLGLFAVGAVMASAKLFHRAPVAAKAPRAIAINVAPLDVKSLLLAGKSAVEKGALDEAVAWFTQAVALQPDLGVAYFSQGVCLAALGKHEDAYRAFRAAHELDRAEGSVRLELARAAARTDRPAEAMEALGPLLVALPVLAEDVADDDAFARMRDHPLFLAMVGRL